MRSAARAAFAAVFALSAAAYGGVTLDFSSAGPLPADAGRGVLRRAAMAVGASAMDPSAVGVGETVELKLFDGVAFSLSVVAAPPAGIAGRSFIARDAAGTASAIVKTGKGGLRVFIDDFGNGRSYTVRAKDGRAEAVELDRTQTGGECCGTCSGGLGDAPATEPAAVPAAGRRAFAAAPAGGSGFDLAEQKTVIDILVAFDQGAKAWARDTWANAEWKDEGTMEEFAGYAVDKMNMVLEKSQLLDRFCYRLVGVTEVDATYTAVNQPVLLALQAGSAPFSNVAAMREKCGADTTTLLVDRTSGDTSGTGFALQGTNGTDYASFAAANMNCNVCDIKRVDERYTMSHETGHNMGCGHSNTQGDDSGPEPGPFPYSCGYHFTDKNGVRRHTVMAYNYDGSGNGNYLSVPYFSTPEITPEEYGVPLGVEGVNDNRQVLIHTHKGVSTYREHKIPYDWDVRFLDGNGNDIPDGAYFAYPLYVTLSHQNPNATIYCTYDGSTPTRESPNYPVGTRIPVYETGTITACAVVDGVAQSVRTVRFVEGVVWKGDSSGAGIWSADQSETPWTASNRTVAQPFENGWSNVEFPDLADGVSPIVTVKGAVSPLSSSFAAATTAYIFEKGGEDATIHLRDACFAPSGDLTFNVPVTIDAVAFTNPANHTLTFNAPFGQTVTETSGYCTNMIGIGSAGTLVVAPGAGKTQMFDTFNNVGWFYNNARFRVGEGTVVFKGPANSNNGLFGSTRLEVGAGGNLVFDLDGRLAKDGTPISGAGAVCCKSVVSANSLVWTNSSWSGTIVFEGLVSDDSTKNFQPERYGNAGSKIVFRNCEIFYFINNNATFPGTLVLDGDGALRFGGNGYSNNWNAFGELAGDGSISASSNHKQAYVFNTATNYTGSISIGAANYASAKQGRRVVFGSVSAAADLPAQSATVTLQSGAAAAIGGSATWSAYHGVDLSGTLAVKGANATLDCDASAATGLRLNDGATLRFDAADAKLTFEKAPVFASGTVRVAFGPGVSPVSGRILVAWPSGSAPDGTFAFSDSALAAQWDLCKTSGGLAVKPKNRFDVPGTELLCFTEAQLSDWLDDNNFWMYEENNPGATWCDFLAETGENGYVNWMNYALGFGAESASEKLVATVSVAGASVTVSVAGSLANAPAIPGGRLLCTLYSADEVGDWDGGTAMEGRTAVLQTGSAPRGFYFVTVSLVGNP